MSSEHSFALEFMHIADRLVTTCDHIEASSTILSNLPSMVEELKWASNTASLASNLSTSVNIKKSGQAQTLSSSFPILQQLFTHLNTLMNDEIMLGSNDAELIETCFYLSNMLQYVSNTQTCAIWVSNIVGSMNNDLLAATNEFVWVSNRMSNLGHSAKLAWACNIGAAAFAIGGWRSNAKVACMTDSIFTSNSRQGVFDTSAWASNTYKWAADVHQEGTLAAVWASNNLQFSANAFSSNSSAFAMQGVNTSTSLVASILHLSNPGIATHASNLASYVSNMFQSVNYSNRAIAAFAYNTAVYACNLLETNLMEQVSSSVDSSNSAFLSSNIGANYSNVCVQVALECVDLISEANKQIAALEPIYTCSKFSSASSPCFVNMNVNGCMRIQSTDKFNEYA